MAAHWCQSEVGNGGFHQFFTNPTGVLAPEALEGFESIQRPDLARLLRSAMLYFGEPFPRDQEVRIAALERRKGKARKEWDPFYDLDDEFYDGLNRETFESSADRMALNERSS
ncbi:MAG: DUF4375 domain-containing protein [Planctomycetota bacterium]|nr:DUF4375 domain-containing protein [Planctomycetota bacterium]